MAKVPKCNQCDSMTINGVYCHERGCPNTDKIWDPEEEEWVEDEPEEDYTENYYEDIEDEEDWWKDEDME